MIVFVVYSDVSFSTKLTPQVVGGLYSNRSVKSGQEVVGLTLNITGLAGIGLEWELNKLRELAEN